MPASGPDLFPNVTAPTGLTEDRYVKAIQTRPIDAKSRQVVHHAITTMLPGGATDADPNANPDSPDGGGTQFIIEYASGKAPEIYPENSGILLKAGSTLSLDEPPALDRRRGDLAGRGRFPAVSEG